MVIIPNNQAEAETKHETKSGLYEPRVRIRTTDLDETAPMTGLPKIISSALGRHPSTTVKDMTVYVMMHITPTWVGAFGDLLAPLGAEEAGPDSGALAATMRM